VRFPTKADVAFYRAKQLHGMPAWVRKIEEPGGPSPALLIDVAINAHAGRHPTPGELAARNLLMLVRSWNSRGLDLEQALRAIAQHPETEINPGRRAGFARKWAAKLAGRSS